MKLTLDGTTVARNFTETVPTYNDIWIHDSKVWIANDEIKDEITKELAKENKKVNPLDDEPVLPNTKKVVVVAPAKKDSDKKDAKTKTDSSKTKTSSPNDSSGGGDIKKNDIHNS
jgi:hypothetical protein